MAFHVLLGGAIISFLSFDAAAQTRQGSSSAPCLLRSVPVEERVPSVGSSDPVKLAAFTWESSRITSTVARIIMEERMGLLVEETAVLAGSHLGPPALAGGSSCGVSDNFAGCDVLNPLAHFVFDAWGGGEKTLNLMDAVIQPLMGSMGYLGYEGTFIPKSALDSGLSRRPQVFMDFYRALNSSNLNLTHFLATRDQVQETIDELGIQKANCTPAEMPQAHAGCTFYEAGTGDYNMYRWLEREDGARACEAICSDNWLMSPACRADPSACVAWVTTGDGWGVEEILQQAVYWNVALAVVVIPDYTSYATLPTRVSSLWFWFFPDPAFMKLDPVKLQEPPTNHAERAARIYRTGAEAVPLRKFQWRYLPQLAPQVSQFLSLVEFSRSDVLEMMLNASREQALEDIACEWVKQNEQRWLQWLPQPHLCAPGWEFNFAMRKCVVCEPGQFADGSPDSGVSASSNTTSCSPCPMGRFSSSVGASTCGACMHGTFANVTGLSACLACRTGRYADAMGLTECLLCSTARNADMWTTMRGIESKGSILWVQSDGAASASQCSCAPGARPVAQDGRQAQNETQAAFSTSNSTRSFECIPCQTSGLECPGLGGVTVQAGYMSGEEVSVYRCFRAPHRCAGGPPGQTCKAGRAGIACSRCLRRMTSRRDGSCRKCRAEDQAPIFVAITTGILVLAMMYAIAERRNFVGASQLLVILSTAFGQLVTILQQLAVLAYFSVDYEEPVHSFVNFVTIFTFDIEVLRMNCFGSWSPMSLYVIKACIPTLAVATVFVIHVIVVVLWRHRRLQEQSATLIATIGVIVMAFFTGIVVTVLAPLQCNKHPNGVYTVTAYEEVVCWNFRHSKEQLGMLGLGSVFINFPLLFFAHICYLCRVFPKRMRQMDSKFLLSYGNLFMRFRPGAHWYLVVITARSLLIAVIPVIRNPVAQIWMLQATLIFSLSLLFRRRPWLVPSMNYLDATFTIGLIFFSDIAAMHIGSTSDVQVIGWIVIIILLATVSMVPIAIFYVICRCFRPRGKKVFQFFLCHVRTETGSLCRLLKMELQENPRVHREVFFDADSLEPVDTCMNYIAAELDCFVVVLSRSTLYMSWCVAEICVAFKKHVDTVPICLEGYQPLTATMLDYYLTDFHDLQVLTHQGLTESTVKDAVLWVDSKERIQIPHTVGPWIGRDLALMLLAPQRFGTLMNSPHPPHRDDTQIAIVADLRTCESVASAGIIRKLLAARMVYAQKCLVTDILMEGQSLPSTTTTVVFVATSKAMHAPSVVHQLLAAADKGLKVLPMVCEEGFAVPTGSMFKDYPTERLPPHEDGSPRAKIELVRLMETLFKDPAIIIRTKAAPMSALHMAANEAATRILQQRVRNVHLKTRSKDSGKGRDHHFNRWHSRDQIRSEFYSSGYGLEESKSACSGFTLEIIPSVSSSESPSEDLSISQQYSLPVAPLTHLGDDWVGDF